MKLVVAICGYNSEQFLKDVLFRIQETIDADAVHYLDGAWRMGGQAFLSTDRTYAILKDFQKETTMQIIYESISTKKEWRLWKSEGEKRNFQLQRIEELYGKDTWILVIDDDELIFVPERKPVRLKNLLRMIERNSKYILGCIPTKAPPPGVALANSQIMNTPRLFKLGQGTHYHTETNMLIHDADCNQLIDYHNEHEPLKLSEKIFLFENIKVENLWMHRDALRMEAKKNYYEYMESPERKIGVCSYEY